MFGLDLQEDYDRNPHTLDPHTYKNTWEYIKSRSIENPTDTILKSMYQAIIYAGIDTNEYTKPNRTYILMHNDAIRRLASNVVQPDCFFGAVTVEGKTPLMLQWEDYPKDYVKNYLLYLIAEKEYSHYTLPPDEDQHAQTLAPVGSLAAQPDGITMLDWLPNPNSVLYIKVLNSSPSNTSDYPIQLNDVRNARTSSLLMTNGVAHVIDRFLTTTIR